MTRERDQHPRMRSAPGRLSRADVVRQGLNAADNELLKALFASDIKTTREHVQLARKLLLEAIEKAKRLA